MAGPKKTNGQLFSPQNWLAFAYGHNLLRGRPKIEAAPGPPCAALPALETLPDPLAVRLDFAVSNRRGKFIDEIQAINGEQSEEVSMVAPEKCHLNVTLPNVSFNGESDRFTEPSLLELMCY